ncbi:hypothetical protein PIB30_045669 [Stylosanthes scabra]|uniref:Protein FAR1-RELATED SEQUENCE n=1 Tax=Stylosanthes scabra TaxID=79078 RepID=A0ABU6QFM8_9FABA|nr:hypothetical protein [Stylosanthes scabra]
MLAMDMNYLFRESFEELANEAIPEDGIYTMDKEDDNTSETLGHALMFGLKMSLDERIRVLKSNELDPNDLANEFGEVQGSGQSTGGGTVPAPTSAEAFMSKQFSGEEEAYQAYKDIRDQKHYDRPDKVHEERLESRRDCIGKLKIYYGILTHVWKVRNIIDDHNHEMAPPLFRNFVPSHRGISDVD